MNVTRAPSAAAARAAQVGVEELGDVVERAAVRAAGRAPRRPASESTSRASSSLDLVADPREQHLAQDQHRRGGREHEQREERDQHPGADARPAASCARPRSPAASPLRGAGPRLDQHALTVAGIARSECRSRAGAVLHVPGRSASRRALIVVSVSAYWSSAGEPSSPAPPAAGARRRRRRALGAGDLAPPAAAARRRPPLRVARRRRSSAGRPAPASAWSAARARRPGGRAGSRAPRRPSSGCALLRAQEGDEDDHHEHADDHRLSGDRCASGVDSPRATPCRDRCASACKPRGRG